ncbi:MAG: DUF4411 family protein [Fimbriimonas sp.]|nr:DUF4411 family protein [Fimbriimonas sp.]
MSDTTFYWDTDAVIWLLKQFPENRVPKLHELVNSEIQNGRFKVCDHVCREIGGKVAKEWVEKNKQQIHVPVTNDIMSVIREVAAVPLFVDPSKTDGRDADHFLVATALAHRRGKGVNLMSGEAAIVTIERHYRPEKEKRSRIPDACDHLSIPCYDFYGWLDNRGFRMDLVPIGGSS